MAWAAAAGTPGGVPMSTSHFGVFSPIVQNGRFVGVKPFRGDPAPTAANAVSQW